jgi:hypothetical protein
VAVICLHQREPAPDTIVVVLVQEEVERAWAGYKQMAPFVSINPDPGDEDLPLINPKGFAKYLEMAYDRMVGFEVSFVGGTPGAPKEVHVTPPIRPRSKIQIGLSVRKTST